MTQEQIENLAKNILDGILTREEAEQIIRDFHGE